MDGMTERGRDRAAAHSARAALVLINDELRRPAPNWSKVRLLAARVVEIADQRDEEAAW